MTICTSRFPSSAHARKHAHSAVIVSYVIAVSLEINWLDMCEGPKKLRCHRRLLSLTIENCTMYLRAQISVSIGHTPSEFSAQNCTYFLYQTVDKDPCRQFYGAVKIYELNSSITSSPLPSTWSLPEQQSADKQIILQLFEYSSPVESSCYNLESRGRESYLETTQCCALFFKC